MKNKRGVLDLSFGMIFSVILVIIFLAAGFYAITKFIALQQTIQIEKFISDFQNDVDTMWKSPQGSQQVSYILPAKITSICFREDEFENLQFSSNQIIRGKMIQHLDIAKIIEKENPFCINNLKGKVSFIIVKDYGETLIKVTK